jgi:hypothetical protein
MAVVLALSELMLKIFNRPHQGVRGLLVQMACHPLHRRRSTPEGDWGNYVLVFTQAGTFRTDISMACVFRICRVWVDT